MSSGNKSGRRSRSVADPSWYESEFNAGDMMMLDPTSSSSSATYEDDPLYTNSINRNSNDDQYYLENGNADPIVDVTAGAGGSGNSNGYRDDPQLHSETDEIIHHKDAGGVGRHAVRKYLWCGVAFVVFVLVVIVPIAVIVPRNKRAAAAAAAAAAAPSTPSNTGSSNSQQSYWNLQDPPQQLSEWCSNTDPNSADYTNCGTYCRMAQCCDVPATDFDTCLNPNDPNIGTRCFSYKQSCNLRADGGLGTPGQDFQDDDLFDTFDNNGANITNNVPVAPPNLPDICNPSYFSSNTIVRLCAQQCAAAQCCWKPTNDANACPTDPECGMYAPCAFLMASNNVNSAVQQDVLDKCQQPAVAQDRQACVGVCEIAKCCFTSDITPDVYTDEQGCFGKPDGFCEEYAACSVLMEKIVGANDDETGFDDDDMTLQVDPTTGLIFPNDNNGDGAATEDDPFEDADNYTLQPPPVDMGIICDPNLIYTNDDSMQQCQDLCLGASCCYLPSLDPNSCLDTLLNVCMDYRSYCNFVYGPDLNQTVQDTSTTVNLDAGNTAYLTDVCSPYSLSTQTGMDACAVACNPAACCFATVSDPNTDAYSQCRAHENCDSYAPCLNLQSLTPSGNDAAENSIQGTIEKMCADLTTPQGLASCQSVCMQHHCCFEDDWLCANAVSAYPSVDDAALQEACELYQGCAKLFNGGSGSDLWGGSVPGPSLSVDQLANDCDETRLAEGDKADCVAACDQAKCCELPENIPGSCLRNNYEVCMMYHKECSAMSVSITQNENAAVPNATLELVAFCSVASLATDYGRQKCKDDCAMATCCWSTDLPSGVESCRDNAHCPGYAPCLALAASGTVNSTAITQQVEATCTISDAQSQQAVQNLAACRAVCLQHRCCWYEAATDDTCFGEDACNQYDGCKYLIAHP